ncbi:heme biosynthesis HemY N-terminal domain-containing protein [Pontibacterium granulatum]|uniref:heme biosynthesis HemY N-terminal domain-containing protein n=1 Tax=Pontibacterium granulatum TaxID=2036029 RepID=UPI00249B7978|nr:heme biosynthesis HemY N-terminal domain-containing protein [Pontibacterium granulatum]MDI3325124.1 heme biosynthesis HemY N-terminal domain-containing protein [Pontibacterium granulatum]
MKKLFILLLVILAAGAWIGQLMVQDPGYVLIAFNQTTIETSLWVMLVIGVLGFLLAHWLLNILTNAMMPVKTLRNWRDRRNHNVSQRKTLKGLMALSEGNWVKAQRQLGQAAERSEIPLINYLAAARAAHEQGDDKAADELLQKARVATPQAEVAVGITQAQIQLARGQLEPCLANLLKLRKLAPKNTYVMRLLKDVYANLQDWDAIAKLLPELKKSQAVRDDKLIALERQTYMNLLNHSLEQLPVETDNASRHSVLDQAWQKLPQNLSGEPALIRRYIELLISINAEPKAEQVLREMIAKQWNEELVNLYGRIVGQDLKKQLKVAQGWIKNHPDSPNLLLTLGRLSLRNQVWGQALSYFEQSFAIQSSQETLAELSRLLRHLGEVEKARDLMQDNLAVVADNLPELPQPKAEMAKAG